MMGRGVGFCSLWQAPWFMSLDKAREMIATQGVEFFLSEDQQNFAIKNDDSQSVAKPLWVPVERHGNFHLALALGVGQTATGPLMQFYRDMSMSCELGLKH
jgi:hypothetical protein